MEGIILLLHLLGHCLCLSHISPQMLLSLAPLISYPRILNLSSDIWVEVFPSCGGLSCALCDI